MSIEEDTSYSTFGVRKEIMATTDIPPQLSPLSPVTDVAIDDLSTRSLGTEHIDHRPPDVNVVEHSAFSHTPSSDVEVSSSPTLGLPIGMLLPLNSTPPYPNTLFFRQNLILGCKPLPLVAHLVQGIRVLLLETRAQRPTFARERESTNLTTIINSRRTFQCDCRHFNSTNYQCSQCRYFAKLS